MFGTASHPGQRLLHQLPRPLLTDTHLPADLFQVALSSPVYAVDIEVRDSRGDPLPPAQRPIVVRDPGVRVGYLETGGDPYVTSDLATSEYAALVLALGEEAETWSLWS